MNNNWQPRIGQKVVCVQAAGDFNLVKGKHYTVEDFQQCKKCGYSWIGYETCVGGDDIDFCNKCNGSLKLILPLWYSSTWRFRPIISDAMEEILSQVQDIERYDGEPVSVPREVVESN